MIVDIKGNWNQNSDGGIDVLSQSSPLVLLVRNVVNSCKALSSYEAATAMLLEMYDVVLSDAIALQELKRGKEEVRAFFEQRNTPQPSTKFEGCNFLTGDNQQVDNIVGKSSAVDMYGHGNVFAKTINTDRCKHEDYYSDKQIAAALLACVGKDKVINNKQKWAGGYWFLRWACNFPVDVKQCCERIMALPYPHKLEIGCDYESIRKICTLSFMDYDPRRMDAVRVSKNDQGMFSQCREIVLKLAEEIEKINLPKE